MISKAEQRFFLDCERDYVSATRIIAEFRRQVQTQCKDIMSRNLKAFAAAIHVSASELIISHYSWPDRLGGFLSEELTLLGVKVKRGSTFEFSPHLWWSFQPEEKMSFGVQISVWDKNRKAMGNLISGLKKRPKAPWQCGEESGAIYIWLELADTEKPKVFCHLERMVVNVIALLDHSHSGFAPKIGSN